jgi:hypothetical protein
MLDVLYDGDLAYCFARRVAALRCRRIIGENDGRRKAIVDFQPPIRLGQICIRSIRSSPGVSNPFLISFVPPAGFQMPRIRESSLPTDGRQSETALQIARGVRRLMRSRGYSTLTELPLLDGRRADIVAISSDSAICIVEVKSSIADFRSDHKWMEYWRHCDRLYFAVTSEFPVDLIPQEAGLIVADAYGAEALREPAERRMPAATRRAILIRFACAAADRLHRLADADMDNVIS